MKPRKTEYKGLVFDSKAEARLALLLDSCEVCWHYHPSSLRLEDGYVPDFLLLEGAAFESECDRMDGASYSINLRVIEYKPSRPTQTYLKELESRLVKCCRLLNHHFNLPPLYPDITPGFWNDSISCELWIGGMGYDQSEACRLLPDGKFDSRWTVGEWFMGYSVDPVIPDVANSQLSGYRFDLESTEHFR